MKKSIAELVAEADASIHASERGALGIFTWMSADNMSTWNEVCS